MLPHVINNISPKVVFLEKFYVNLPLPLPLCGVLLFGVLNSSSSSVDEMPEVLGVSGVLCKTWPFKLLTV